MPRYALLLNHAPTRYTEISREEYTEIMTDYFAWVQDKVSEGLYLAGHKLKAEEGISLTSRNGALDIHNITSTEVAEVLGGIMIIEAPNMDVAVDLAKDHPHFVHNTNMMVVPIDPASEN